MNLDNIRLIVAQLTAMLEFDQGKRWEEIGIETKIERLRQTSVSQMHLIKLQAETTRLMQSAIEQMQESRRVIPMEGKAKNDETPSTA